MVRISKIFWSVMVLFPVDRVSLVYKDKLRIVSREKCDTAPDKNKNRCKGKKAIDFWNSRGLDKVGNDLLFEVLKNKIKGNETGEICKK